ncbi:MAG: hypothetical protein PWR13_279 [Archaeoglobi archaeon]|nr:hypothetical protein [Archaeoglobi archaeon]
MPKITRSMLLETVYRILKENGVDRVSRRALEVLSEFLEGLIRDIERGKGPRRACGQEDCNGEGY